MIGHGYGRHPTCPWHRLGRRPARGSGRVRGGCRGAGDRPARGVCRQCRARQCPPPAGPVRRQPQRGAVLAIASHIHTDQVGTGFFQETHPERIFVDASVWRETLPRAEQMPRLDRVAIQQALGTPGVSVLTLPGDVADLRAVHPTGAGAYCVARKDRPCDTRARLLASSRPVSNCRSRRHGRVRGSR